MTSRRLVNLQLGSINTSKYLNITTSELLYTIHSGNRASELSNVGSYTVYYGQSGFIAGSGGTIPINGSKFWDTVVDNFTLYLKLSTAGVTSQVVAQEYAGD